MKKVGLYIHIPFCKQKCIYCDFLSFSQKNSRFEEYFNALKKEILNYSRIYKDKVTISSIFIGGGTPSYPDAEYIVDVMKTVGENFTVDKNAEISIECNPGSANLDAMKKYREAGINRISFGVQSTDNDILKFLGRIHDKEQFVKSVLQAREVGFRNINADLIFGIPNQTNKQFSDSIDMMIELEIPHISAYSLIIEPETKLYDMVDKHEVVPCDDEIDREMYHNAINKLHNHGYNHYEISNFALSGFECKHNIMYWKTDEYFGVGLGAASYYGNKRYSNTGKFEEYCKNPHIDENETEELSIEDKMNEFMMLGFRLIDGPDSDEFFKRFNVSYFEIFKEKLEKVSDLIEIKGNNYCLNSKGLDFANIIFSEFCDEKKV